MLWKESMVATQPCAKKKDFLVITYCHRAVDVQRTTVGGILAVLRRSLKVGQLALSVTNFLAYHTVVGTACHHDLPVDDGIAHLVNHVCKRLSASVSPYTDERTKLDIATALSHVIFVPVAAPCWWCLPQSRVLDVVLYP